MPSRPPYLVEHHTLDGNAVHFRYHVPKTHFAQSLRLTLRAVGQPHKAGHPAPDEFLARLPHRLCQQRSNTGDTTLFMICCRCRCVQGAFTLASNRGLAQYHPRALASKTDDVYLHRGESSTVLLSVLYFCEEEPLKMAVALNLCSPSSNPNGPGGNANDVVAGSIIAADDRVSCEEGPTLGRVAVICLPGLLLSTLYCPVVIFCCLARWAFKAP